MLSPLLRPTAQEKSFFKIVLPTDNAAGHPRALMEKYKEMQVFVPSNTTPILATLTGVWKKLNLTLLDDFEESKTSVEEVTANVEETVRELELEVAPEDMTECILIKLLTDEELLFMVSKQSNFLRWNVLLVKVL